MTILKKPGSLRRHHHLSFGYTVHIKNDRRFVKIGFSWFIIQVIKKTLIIFTDRKTILWLTQTVFQMWLDFMGNKLISFSKDDSFAIEIQVEYKVNFIQKQTRIITYLYGWTHKGTRSISQILWNMFSSCEAINSCLKSSPHFTITESSFQLARWPYGELSLTRLSFSWENNLLNSRGSRRFAGFKLPAMVLWGRPLTDPPGRAWKSCSCLRETSRTGAS